MWATAATAGDSEVFNNCATFGQTAVGKSKYWNSYLMSIKEHSIYISQFKSTCQTITCTKPGLYL